MDAVDAVVGVVAVGAAGVGVGVVGAAGVAGQGVAFATVALCHGAAGLGNTGWNGEAGAEDAGSNWGLDAGRTVAGRDEALGLGDAAAAAAAAAAVAGGEEDCNRGRRTKWTASQDGTGRSNRPRDSLS